MQLSHESTKVLITGASGCGKSTFWTRLILGYPAQTKFVFDHEGELQQRLRVRAAETPAGLALAAASGWCIFDPGRLWPGRGEEAFTFFADFAFQVSSRLPGTKLFACDELQMLIGTHTIPQELRCILQTGRRYGLDCVLVSQQPNELHNKVRAQLTEVVSFVQAEPRAIEWLAGYGFQEEGLRALRPGEFVGRRRGAAAETRGRVF